MPFRLTRPDYAKTLVVHVAGAKQAIPKGFSPEVQVPLAPQQGATIELHSVFPLWPNSRGWIFLGADPLRVRHPLVNTPARANTYTLSIPLTGRWVQDAEIQLRFAYPAHLRGPGATNGDGRLAVLEITAQSRKKHGFIRLSAPSAPVFRNGGPFLDLGGVLEGGFRMRAGYDIGFGSYALSSLTIETDFSSDCVIAPAAGAGLMTLAVIPSVSAQLGAALQVAPDFEAGLRMQTTLSYAYLSFVTSIDYWPEADDWTFGFYGRLGF